jgi:hypothetical protein
MIQVSKADLEKIRLELDQIASSAFWMETYTLGLQERAKRLKKYISDLETVATRPDTHASSQVRQERKTDTVC